jgi:hypothetical protein
VIQLDYPATAAPSRAAQQAPSFRLAWLNPTTGLWTNAVVGNTSGTPHFINRAYNPATDFAVGNYGIDSATHHVWAVVDHNSLFAVATVADPLAVVSAVSRKTHGSAGTFDVPLYPNGATECRSGGATGNHTIVFTFSSEIASGEASVTSGSGSIAGNPVIAGNTITVNLTGVWDAQRLALTLSNVTDTSAQMLPDTAITAGFLLGDVVPNGTVNSTDIGQTKSQSGAILSASNFRSDVNASGTVNASDIGQIKASAGHMLP